MLSLTRFLTPHRREIVLVLALALFLEGLVARDFTGGVLDCPFYALPGRRRLFRNRILVVTASVRIVRAIVIHMTHELPPEVRSHIVAPHG